MKKIQIRTLPKYPICHYDPQRSGCPYNEKINSRCVVSGEAALILYVLAGRRATAYQCSCARAILKVSAVGQTVTIPFFTGWESLSLTESADHPRTDHFSCRRDYGTTKSEGNDSRRWALKR